jgi:hypothetical protein
MSAGYPTLELRLRGAVTPGPSTLAAAAAAPPKSAARSPSGAAPTRRSKSFARARTRCAARAPPRAPRRHRSPCRASARVMASSALFPLPRPRTPAARHRRHPPPERARAPARGAPPGARPPPGRVCPHGPAAKSNGRRWERHRTRGPGSAGPRGSPWDAAAATRCRRTDSGTRPARAAAASWGRSGRRSGTALANDRSE